MKYFETQGLWPTLETATAEEASKLSAACAHRSGTIGTWGPSYCCSATPAELTKALLALRSHEAAGDHVDLKLLLQYGMCKPEERVRRAEADPF